MVPNIDLDGRVCVVTGASGELGRVISRTLGAAGAKVALHWFEGEERAKALLEELESEGVPAMTVQASVTEMESVAAMHTTVEAELGSADIIVDNAVIQYTWVPVLEQSLEDFESQFRSCVMHNVHMVKAFAPGMIARGWGRVIGNVSKPRPLMRAPSAAWTASTGFWRASSGRMESPSTRWRRGG
jgi:3-oxoacyl-[acyl-carrier protein] reductase